MLIPLCQPLFKHALDLPMGSLNTQSPLLNHWHRLANIVAMRARRGSCHGHFLLAQKPEPAERLIWKQRGFSVLLGVAIWAVCALIQSEIPFVPCSICREVKQNEPLWVSLALSQPCSGAAPLRSVLSSVQPRASPALCQVLWSCWECVHPNHNSSGMDTLLVHKGHFPKQGHGITLFP